MGNRTRDTLNRRPSNTTIPATAGSPRFDGLADTNFTDASLPNNSFPVYNTSNSKWNTLTASALAALLGTGVSRFQDLTDVTANFGSTPNGYIPIFDSGTGKLVMAANTGGGGGGAGLGIAVAKWFTVDVSGVVVSRLYDSCPGNGMTSSATVGPAIVGWGAQNPVLTMPSGVEFVKATASIYFPGAASGEWVMARILRWQPAQSSPLNPATSTYNTAYNEHQGFVTYFFTAAGSNNFQITLETDTVEGDQYAVDIYGHSSGISGLVVGNLSCIALGTGANFGAGGGGGGGGSTTLAGLTDVDVTGGHAPNDGDALVWNATDGKWEPAYIPTLFDTSGAPSGGIGRNGDFAIDPTTGTFYSKSGGVWDAGVAFPAGSGGGTTILSGSGAPGSMLGSVGNYYLDTTNNILYGPKTNPISWPTPPISLGVSMTGVGYTGTTATGGTQNWNAGWGGASLYQVPAGVSYAHVTAQVAWTTTNTTGAFSTAAIQRFNSSGTPYAGRSNEALQTVYCNTSGIAGVLCANLSFVCPVVSGDYFSISVSGGSSPTLNQTVVQVRKAG